MITQKGSIPNCTYFYGVTPEEMQAIKQMPYIDALKKKNELAKALKERLVHNFSVQDWDTMRIEGVKEAMRVNQEMIDE